MLLLLTLLLTQAGPASAATAKVASGAAAAAPDSAHGSEHASTGGAEEDPATGGDPTLVPGSSDEPGELPDGTDGAPSEPAGRAEEEPHSLDASLESAAGRMGERHLELLVRAQSGEVTLIGGAETLASDRAPERRAVIFGAEVSHGDLSWEVELRTAPQSAGLARTVAKLGVHGDLAGLSILGRDESLHGTRLRAAGLALDLEGRPDSAWKVALAASAWVTDLSTPSQGGVSHRSRDPWSAFGAATLDWAQRWELNISAKRTWGFLSITSGLGVAQPAQDGAWAAQASLGLEKQLGPVRLGLSAALAHLWPTGLWLADATLGISWHVGSD